MNKYKDLVSEYWEFLLRTNPLSASQFGVHKYNDQLGEVSVEAMLVQLDELRAMNLRYQSISPDSLPSDERMNHRILGYQIQARINNLEAKSYYFPINSFSAFYYWLPQMHTNIPLNGLDDYLNYIARLHAIPQLVEDYTLTLRTAIEQGYTPAKAALKGALDSLNKQIKDDPTESGFYEPFMQFPRSISSDDRLELKTEAQKVIKDKIIPAFSSFAYFMEHEYIPSARDNPGAHGLPDGKEFYQAQITRYTTTTLSAQEIHDIGKKEVARIHEEMNEIINDLNFEGDFKQFTQFLRTDPQFYATSADQLLERAAYICKKIDGKLPELFSQLPRLPYGIEVVPEAYAPYTTTAYYSPGNADGTKAGNYYINTYDLPSRPLYELEALTLHEAVPGHHLQIALQHELDNLPDFRKFEWYSAFGEGWALYSERLGLECGFYEDLYSNFGRLSYEMWRATRLVVDTGIHALGWTEEQAVSYMMEHTSLTELNIRNEITRYIGWPGQALAYKMGEIRIRQLRARAEEKLGRRFDIREFHRRLLENGSIPLDILEQVVDEWLS
ncbi:MAG: DUF885 domain-containing protein [Candidatus Heimdallarchaeota archaeon]|nr:DUF885 domain-containing protein [Candidatus Heimdallarchaeota archaeon]